MGGRKRLYLLGFTSSFLFLLISYQAQASSNILINQIQTSGGTGATNQDFIELYNKADQAFDLKGCKLVKRTATGSTDTNIKAWSSSTIISSHGYYLWSNSNYSTISTTPDATTSETISDNNSLALRCGSSEPLTIMDALTWGQVTNPLGEGESLNNPEPNQVLQRKSLNNTKQDSDNNQADFEINSPNPHNSSFVENTINNVTQFKEVINTIYVSPPALTLNTGDVVINEIVSDPTIGETEWVELYNKSNKTINLSDLTLEDASGSNMQLSGTLSNDQFNKFAVIKNLKFTLNNDSESILLKYQGLIIDRVTYNKNPSNNSALAAVKPNSLSRVPDGQDTDQDNVDFKLSKLTPNLANEQINFIQTSEESTTSDLIINELFPNPIFDDQAGEFIELFNNNSNKIDLNNWLIKDNLSTYKINNQDFPNTIIEANSFFVLPRFITNLVLDNETKETIEIISPDQKNSSKLSYSTPAPEDQSYSRGENGKYSWSLSVTPNKTNITIPPNLPPKLSLLAPDEGAVNELLIFDASDSADPELNKLSYVWDFGDGSSSNLATPSHAYAQAKTYTVWLTITDSANNSSKKSTRVKIIDTNKSNNNLTESENKQTKTIKKNDSSPTDKQLITGVVTIPPSLISKNTFYIDTLEYPVQISKPLDFIKSGQQISLTGELKNYSNGPKFFVSKKDTVANLGLGEIAEPHETNLSDLNINQDNTLIKINGQITKLSTKSLTIKEGEEELKISTLNPLNKNTFVKGSTIKAVGYLKYENGIPKMYITNNENISVQKNTQQTKAETINIAQNQYNYSYLYWLLALVVALILVIIFWEKISKNKLLNKIRGLF